MKKRELIGTITSHKMTKTAVVRVDRRVKDPQFKKIVVKHSTFLVHDEKNECNTGDTVLIGETRPLSRGKSWKLRKILRKGQEEAV